MLFFSPSDTDIYNQLPARLKDIIGDQEVTVLAVQASITRPLKEIKVTSSISFTFKVDEFKDPFSIMVNSLPEVDELLLSHPIKDDECATKCGILYVDGVHVFEVLINKEDNFGNYHIFYHCFNKEDDVKDNLLFLFKRTRLFFKNTWCDK